MEANCPEHYAYVQKYRTTDRPRYILARRAAGILITTAVCIVLILTSCCILLRIVRELLRTSSNSCMHNIIVFILCIVLLASIVLLLELLSSMHTVYNMDSTSVVYCSSGIHNRDPKYCDTPIHHVRAYAYELVVCIWHTDIMYVYHKKIMCVSSSVNRAVKATVGLNPHRNDIKNSTILSSSCTHRKADYI